MESPINIILFGVFNHHFSHPIEPIDIINHHQNNQKYLGNKILNGTYETSGRYRICSHVLPVPIISAHNWRQTSYRIYETYPGENS